MTDLAALKGSNLPGYPLDQIVLYAPRDGARIHAAILALLTSAEHSILINMYGYDDDEADAIIRQKMVDPNVYVQMSVDSSQFAGVHEKAIFAKWPNDAIGSSVAVGVSLLGAISHDKLCIVDGVYMISGSTNWSMGGELKQDNQFTVTSNPILAAEATAVLNIIHDGMLKQMAAKRSQP